MGKHIRSAALLAAVAAVASATRGTAEAYVLHHRRPTAVAAPAPSRPARSFYPESVEGGVPGNLSFNNQLRKFSDPLNANGGR